jgi:hypothetical protein
MASAAWLVAPIARRITKAIRTPTEDEVRDELPFLHEENEHLGKLLDNRDDMLREAKKMRK